MMGVDVDMASKLFGDPIEYDKAMRKQEEAEERAKRMTAVADKLASIGDRLAVAFSPLLISHVTIIPVADAMALIFGNPIVASGIALFNGLHWSYENSQRRSDINEQCQID